MADRDTIPRFECGQEKSSEFIRILCFSLQAGLIDFKTKYLSLSSLLFVKSFLFQCLYRAPQITQKKFNYHQLSDTILLNPNLRRILRFISKSLIPPAIVHHSPPSLNIFLLVRLVTWPYHSLFIWSSCSCVCFFCRITPGINFQQREGFVPRRVWSDENGPWISNVFLYSSVTWVRVSHKFGGYTIIHTSTAKLLVYGAKFDGYVAPSIVLNRSRVFVRNLRDRRRE